ncbi:MAG: TolC family protein [Candidatus Gastranaerophilaceae bacterium]
MKKFLITLFLNICLVSASYAVDIPEKISLPQALDLAVQNNIDYKSAKLDIDIAKNKIKEANRLQNPDFNIFYNFGSAGRGNPQQIGLSKPLKSPKEEHAKTGEIKS